LDAAIRRYNIMKLLCRRRHETTANLAMEFGVSVRTMRRDIDFLSLTEPIYTKCGRFGGGVYVMDGYTVDNMYFKGSETKVMEKVLDCAEKKEACQLSSDEITELKQLVKNYTKPNAVQKKC